MQNGREQKTQKAAVETRTPEQMPDQKEVNGHKLQIKNTDNFHTASGTVRTQRRGILDGLMQVPEVTQTQSVARLAKDNPSRHLNGCLGFPQEAFQFIKPTLL